MSLYPIFVSTKTLQSNDTSVRNPVRQGKSQQGILVKTRDVSVNVNERSAKKQAFKLFAKRPLNDCIESDEDEDDNVPLSSLAKTSAPRQVAKRAKSKRADVPSTKSETSTASDGLGENEQSDEKHVKEAMREPSDSSTPSQWTHLLHQLISRTVTGRRLSRPPAAHSCWSPWCLLDHSVQVELVTSMAWDHVGILLAMTTTQNMIYIYDWDVVRAAHRKCESKVEAMFTLSTPWEVTSLQWDTNDCLAVAFRGYSQVRVYDVARLVERNDAASCFVSLDRTDIATSSASTAMSVRALPRRQWLVSYRDGTLVLWKISRSKATLQWKWCGDTVWTGMYPLSDTSVLLTSTQQWIVLDYKNCTRKAFSTEKTPTICRSWSLPSCGNVQALQLKKSSTCHFIDEHGWIMSVDLHGNRSPKVLHRPPRVILQTASTVDGSLESKVSTQHFSQPLTAVVACATSSLICWDTVRQVTHVLPHHDRRHVGGTLQVERSKNYSLSLLDAYGRTIQLKQPTCAESMTLHPSNEWLVVAGRDGRVHVWTARKLSKRKNRFKV